MILAYYWLLEMDWGQKRQELDEDAKRPLKV